VRLLFLKDNLAQEGGFPTPYNLYVRLFTGVCGRGVLRTSPQGGSRKVARCLLRVFRSVRHDGSSDVGCVEDGSC
jgi:hypothetical protein